MTVDHITELIRRFWCRSDRLAKAEIHTLAQRKGKGETWIDYVANYAADERHISPSKARQVARWLLGYAVARPWARKSMKSETTP